MKFGCVSPRRFWYSLHETLGRFSGQKSQPPVSLVGQLLWREFFYCVGAYTPNFDKMEGNPICVQVDWDENDEYFQVALWSKIEKNTDKIAIQSFTVP